MRPPEFRPATCAGNKAEEDTHLQLKCPGWCPFLGTKKKKRAPPPTAHLLNCALALSLNGTVVARCTGLRLGPVAIHPASIAARKARGSSVSRVSGILQGPPGSCFAAPLVATLQDSANTATHVLWPQSAFTGLHDSAWQGGWMDLEH